MNIIVKALITISFKILNRQHHTPCIIHLTPYTLLRAQK